MSRIQLTLLSIVTLALLLCGCSSRPPNPEDTATPAAAAKPQYDFGAAEVSPREGSGKEATFRVAIKPASQKPVLIGLMFNESMGGAHACYAFRNVSSGSNFLVADSGSGAVPVDGKSAANHQCGLLSEGTGFTDDASGVTATFHVRFLPAFRGAKHMWLFLADGKGNGPDPQELGGWTVQ